MGQRLNKPGAKKSQIIEAWKKGKESVWKLSINCVETNRELASQVIANEKKINKLKELNKSLETDLAETQQKLKQLQQTQATLVKTNKRMSSVLVDGPNQEKRKIFLSCVASSNGTEENKFIVM